MSEATDQLRETVTSDLSPEGQLFIKPVGQVRRNRRVRTSLCLVKSVYSKYIFVCLEYGLSILLCFEYSFHYIIMAFYIIFIV